MKKSKKLIIQVREDDGTVSDIPIDNQFIEFYKKETGKKKATARGLSKFINHLIDLHN